MNTIAQISYREGIEGAWADLVAFAPKLIGAIIVFVVGWFVARIIRTAIHQALVKVRFDAAVDRAGLGAPLERAGFADSALLLAKIFYWAVMILVLQLAIDTFGDSAIQSALDDLVGFLPKLFIAIVIVVISGAIASRVGELVRGTLGGESYGNTLARLASGSVWLVGIFAALNQIEIAQQILTTLFTAIVATLGVVIAIMFGVGGIKAAQEEFWPKVFARFSSSTSAGEPLNN